MIWYISVTIFYLNLDLPLYTNYHGGLFRNEARCYRYLNEHKNHLEKSFTNTFAEYNYEGIDYVMEAFRFECKTTPTGTEV